MCVLELTEWSLFVPNRAFLYFLAFVASWTPSTIWSARHYKSGATFGLDLAAAICEPYVYYQIPLNGM